ncbi:MAG: DUF4032 domain-containing protein [Chloroflexota bacterium]
MTDRPLNMVLRPGFPDFIDLPWGLPLSQWSGSCARLEQVPQGLSRHPVVFVNYDGTLFALKELPPDLASCEYEMLRELEDLHVPAVTPVGHVLVEAQHGKTSVLITRYLEQSLPYRNLFMSEGLKRYRQHLLDAIAGLLVQLHLAGVYWGDCSLSNTLFRRDAGALRAYLVDAETSEIYPDHFPAMLRFHELEIMEENINGELLDLRAIGALRADAPGVPVANTGTYIRLRYQSLWEEITREDIINTEERYRIQERIRALNALGFSVGDVALQVTEHGEQLRLRVVVSDRNFHRDQLSNLTGLDVEEMQARLMMNEIQELRATLARLHDQSTSLSVAAFHWLEQVYKPVAEQLQPLTDEQTSVAELYCQMLEHKWYLSERAQQDVGHQAATEDYIRCFGQGNDKENLNSAG